VKDRLFERKVESIEVGSKRISELVSEMGKTAYQGRRLAEAVDVWEAMLREENLVIALGLAGSMSTAGQWKMINWLIRRRFVDLIVATGANVSEDIVDAMGYGYWQGSPGADDEELLRQDVNRYYDVYGRESDYRKMEDLITEFILGLDTGFHYTSMEFLHLFGRWMNSRGIESIAAIAAENNVPIFSPAISDSAYGEAFLLAKNQGHTLVLDQVKEFDQFVSIGERAADFGVVYLGGGVPKDFTQLLAISVSPRTRDEGVAGRQGYMRQSVREFYYPHKYAVQITTDAPQWGGLSGCTLEEAVSWGKIAGQGRRATCYCDVTIALPLVVHALDERVKARRAFPDMGWLFRHCGG